MSGLTSTGFVAKTVEEIIADLQARQRSTIDASLNDSATGVIANLNASFALELGPVWELAQEIYDAHDPNSAAGIAADHNGALSGVTRLDQRKSTITWTLTLDANTTVGAGSVASVVGNPAARFVTVTDVSTVDAGTVDVVAQSEAFGPVAAIGGSVWQIDSPTSGWTGVSNALPADPGVFVETDEAYRIRRAEVITSQGGSTTAGIVADIRKLSGVREASALENESDVTDANGLPPHSFEIIVHTEGADANAIAASIWKNKPAGIESFSAAAPVVFTDSEGVDHNVYFTETTPVFINIRYAADVDSTYVTGGIETAINNAATQDPANPAYFGVGKPVYLLRLLVAGSGAQGVINLTLDAARDPIVPATAIPAAPNDQIFMGARELPVPVNPMPNTTVLH